MGVCGGLLFLIYYYYIYLVILYLKLTKTRRKHLRRVEAGFNKMQTITFTVLGIPLGQPRARATVRGTDKKTGKAKAGTYNPKGQAENWKAGVAEVAAAYAPPEPLEGPLLLYLLLSYPTKDPKRAGKPMPAKPDADNAAKLIMDAMTAAGFWKDDAQVSRLEVRKRYAEIGRPARASVAVGRDE